MTLSARQAARLIERDYAGYLEADDRLTANGTDAAIVRAQDETILLVRGSDGKRDWLRNIWTLGTVWPAEGDSGRKYHGGHLAGARDVWEWIQANGPDPNTDHPESEPLPSWRGKITACIGHSRGGPIASIVGASLGVPTITFASPPCVVSGDPLPGDANVLNILHWWDPVRFLPPWMSHIGATKVVNKRGHGIRGYLKWV